MAGRSIKASESGVEKARLELTNKAWSQEKLAEEVKIGRQTVNKFFACKPIGRTNFVEICKVLGISWHEVADLPEEVEVVEPIELIEPCENYEIDVLVQQVSNTVRLAIHDRCGTIKVLDMVQPVDLNDIYTDVNVLERISGRRRIEISELFRKLQKSREIQNSDSRLVQDSFLSDADTNHDLEIENIPGLNNKDYPRVLIDFGTAKIVSSSMPYEISKYKTIFFSADSRVKKVIEEQENYEEWNDEIERFGLGLITEERVSAKDVVARYPRLMLLGKPGAGKTTFLKYLAVQCINGGLLANRIPVFITLKDFAESENKLSILDFIQNFFLNFGLNKEQFFKLLKQGRFLFLFDGLDEVREEDGERITNQIKEFSSNFFYSNEFRIDSQKYPDKSLLKLRNEYPDKIYTNSFVLTCRIAANEYTFENFTEVEVADFNDAQIKKFAQNWFNARDPKRLDRFIQKLDDNKPIKELGNNPLLLTLLCLVFEDSGDFPRNRAELYKAGLFHSKCRRNMVKFSTSSTSSIYYRV